MPNRQDFISRARQHGTNLINEVNDLQNLLVEARRLGHLRELTSADLQGANGDVTPEDMQVPMATIGDVLSSITEEQKDAIFRLKL